MNFKSLAFGENWMSTDETELYRQFVLGVETLLRERGVANNPLLVLRVDDVAVSWLIVRRMEAGLATDDGPKIAPAQADAIGKCRERLRKAIRELEEFCERAGTPIDTGLADRMKPVIQQIQGTSPFCSVG